jgi:hypothetical protein
MTEILYTYPEKVEVFAFDGSSQSAMDLLTWLENINNLHIDISLTNLRYSYMHSLNECEVYFQNVKFNVYNKPEKVTKDTYVIFNRTTVEVSTKKLIGHLHELPDVITHIVAIANNYK